jgi:iron complex outermembrane receptor protein
MMRSVIFWTLFGVLSIFNILSAQDCKLSLSGVVRDAHTGDPVAFVDVFLQGTTTGTSTNEQGSFLLENICPGTYHLVASHIGCEHFVKDILLEKDSMMEILLEEHSYEIDHVMIHAEKPAYTGPAAQNQLSGADLLSRQGQSLAQALDGIPGVQMLQTGSGVAKPIIQGMHSNRILILNNGIRQEGQQWGADHAPEIDPFVARNITVVKGALGVKYGPDAIGGVIIVEPGSLFQQDALGGEAILSGASNGRAMGLSASYTGKISKDDTWRYRLQCSMRKAGNARTPDYFLENTGLEEYNFSISTSMRKQNSGLDLYYSLFNAKVGILVASHIHNITDLKLAIERGRPEGEGEFSYSIGRPMQRVQHHLLKASYWWLTESGNKWAITSGTQYDDRNEFDAHRPYNELLDNVPNLILQMSSQSLDFAFEEKVKQGWTMNAGIQGMAQMASAPRGRLIPSFSSWNTGIFITERWKKAGLPIDAEFGLRYDLRFVQLLTPPRGSEELPSQRFGNASWSAGLNYRIASSTFLQLHLSNAWRAPNVNESFAHGVHHGTASYEIGNPNLRKEVAYNSALVLKSAKSDSWQFQSEWYYYRINNYIFSMPDTVPTLTIRGAFPTFRYDQADADLYGWNLSAQVHLSNGFWMKNSTSILFAQNRELNQPLIWIPANRTEIELLWKEHSDVSRFNIQPGIRVQYVAAQTRIPEAGDYLPPPDAYLLLHARVSGESSLFGRKWMWSLQARNILNTRYRDYLNRLRYFSDETGRNIQFHIKKFF